MPHTNDSPRRIDLKSVDLVCGMAGFRSDFRAISLRTQMVTKFV
jgi:hypothetical protein